MVSKAINHVAIILDGNRRYAKKIGLNVWKGHERGLKKLESLFQWCMEIGIKELTLYCFSTENFKRDKKEIDFLFNLFWKEFGKIKGSEGIYKNKVRINTIGRISMFPKKMQDAMNESVIRTRKNKKLIVNLALAYGGRQEITDAVKKIVKQVESDKINPDKINEDMVTNNLYMKNEPDLIIRPGGEIRTSNFLTWQSAYSEWIFTDKLWPEFTKQDLISCIEEFSRRERRFGK